MLRKKSIKEIGFIPDIVTDVGYATLPCVSRELAESCSHFVTTIVMQDDIIHRLSAASPARLRNEFFKLIGEYAYDDNLKDKSCKYMPLDGLASLRKTKF